MPLRDHLRPHQTTLVIVTIAVVALVGREQIAAVLPSLRDALPSADGPLPFFLILAACAFLFALLCRKARSFLAQRSAPFFYRLGLIPALRVLAGNRHTAMGLCQYAATLHDTNRSKEAAEVYSLMIRHNAREPTYWINRGALYSADKDYEAAISDLTHALALDSKNKVARAYRGLALVAAGRFQEACGDLESIDCDNRADAWIAWARGGAREHLGAWEQAIDDYILAHHLDNSFIYAGVALARMQAGCPKDALRDGPKAVEIAHQICVQSGWTDWLAISVLAAAHSECGDFANAIQYAKQTLELAPAHEKAKRERRIVQYESGIPFRIDVDA